MTVATLPLPGERPPNAAAIPVAEHDLARLLAVAAIHAAHNLREVDTLDVGRDLAALYHTYLPALLPAIRDVLTRELAAADCVVQAVAAAPATAACAACGHVWCDGPTSARCPESPL